LRFSNGVANGDGNSSAAVFIGRHPELRGGALIQTAAGAVTGIVERGGDRRPRLQLLFEVVQAAGIGILTRGNSQHRLKAALQVKGTLLEGRAQAREGERLI